MRRPDLSELETIVATAEARAVEATRAASAADRRLALRAIRERAGAALADALPQLDKAALDRLRREHDAELYRLAGDAKRRTVAAAAEASRRIGGLVAAERAALDALPTDPFGPGSDLLLEVDFIRSWPSPENLRDSRQQPGVNWAKFAFNSGSTNLGHFHEKVSFYTVWQNPRDEAVLADVLVRLTATGHVECSAEWRGVSSWFGWPDTRSKADVSARLTLWGLWAEPAPIYLVDSVPLKTVVATGGFFGDSSSASIEGVAPAVATTGFAVPARASMLIEASLAVDYELEAGAVDVDFATDDLFAVGWAYGVVTLPPAKMVNL